MTLDELDGVAVAPGNHAVIFENDEVRVLEITIPAGTDHAGAHAPRPDRAVQAVGLALRPP